MDVAVFWLVIVGPLLVGVAATIWFGNGGRTLALWIGFTGIVLLILAPVLQLQKFVNEAVLPPSVSHVSGIVSHPAASPHQTDLTAMRRVDLDRYPRKTCFDYSTNDGLVNVALNTITFEIRFSKASSDRIYVYKDGTNLRAIANLRGVKPDDTADFSAFDSSSRVYTVPLGGYFIAQNDNGYFLLARILSIKDDTRGDSSDEVCFAYQIDTSKIGRFKAL